MRGDRGLRVLEGESNGNFVAEALGDTDAVLAGEDKSDVIRRVDRLRPRVVGSAQVVVGRDAAAVLGHQTPHLATEERKSIVELSLSPGLAETERVAVGLVRVGGNAGGKEVSRDIAGKVHVFQAAIDEGSNLRLAAGTEELRNLTLRSARHGHGVVGRGQVSGERAGAANERGFRVSAGSDVDAAEVDRDRAFHLLV